MFFKKHHLKIALFIILFLGGYGRFTGLNWDQHHHLQPDERYISMVLSALRPPPSLINYLHPDNSTLSPYANGFGSYIYGQLPLTVLTYLSRWFGMDGYDKAYLLGRGMSAMLDMLSIILIYKLGKKLWNGRVGIIGAAFYAFSPLAIQYAHFMTMESWVTFFWLIIILLLTRFPRPDVTSAPARLQAPGMPATGGQAMIRVEKFRKLLKGILVGMLVGAAVAVKASSVVLVPMVVGVQLVVNWSKLGKFGEVAKLGTSVLTTLIIAILFFRFFQPAIFADSSWLDWSLRQDFYQALNFQRLAIDGKVMFPPQWQWVNTGKWWFPFRNIVLWGLGPMAGGLAVIGIIWQIGQIGQRRPAFAKVSAGKQIRLLLAVWIAAIFFWQGGKFVKNMRYFLPFFPLYALFAASVFHSAKRTIRTRTVLFAGIGLSGLWALMFTHIYQTPTTRVAASEWIYQNIPAGSKILLEEWDDPLPLPLPGYKIIDYQTEMGGVYAPDDDAKREQVRRWTKNFDWIVLSSSRAKGSIGKLPGDFPLMVKFYRDLDHGGSGFVKTAEFTSFPHLEIGNWKLEINDSSAEESFWVYDHPMVEIYRKLK